MPERNIIVLPYDPQWRQDFEAIRAELTDALGDPALRIEHVGSTSVRGLSAKPVIDIDVVIESRSVLPQVIAQLNTIGYEHEGDLGIPGREAFRYDGKDHLREHHLYVCSADSDELRRHTAFRDYLRSHPQAVREYSRIKEEGAGLYPHDISGYMAYKSSFIERVFSEENIS